MRVVAEWKAEWKKLPPSLQVVVVAFAVVPSWALGMLDSPESLVRDYSPLQQLFLVAAYAVVPWTVATLAFARHWSFLALLFADAALLAAQPWILEGGGDETIGLMRASLSAFVFVFALFLVRRDFLLPALGGRGGLWRRARRHNHNVRLSVKILDETFSAVLENASTTGLALAANEEAVRPLLDRLKKGGNVAVEVPLKRGAVTIESYLMWRASHPPLVAFGVNSAETKVLQDFIDELATSLTTPRWQRRLWRLARRSLVQQLSFVAWIAALIAIMITPVLVRAWE